MASVIFVFNPHLRTFFHLFWMERKGERETLAREALIGFLPYLPGWEIICAQTEDRIPDLGMCLDQELNLHPFGYRMTLQPTEPHQPGKGLSNFSFCIVILIFPKLLVRRRMPFHKSQSSPIFAFCFCYGGLARLLRSRRGNPMVSHEAALPRVEERLESTRGCGEASCTTAGA